MSRYVTIVVEIEEDGFEKAMKQFVDAPRSTYEEQIDRENAARVLLEEGSPYVIWPLSENERDVEALGFAVQEIANT